jgi:hypothetical protein
MRSSAPDLKGCAPKLELTSLQDHRRHGRAGWRLDLVHSNVKHYGAGFNKVAPGTGALGVLGRGELQK